MVPSPVTLPAKADLCRGQAPCKRFLHLGFAARTEMLSHTGSGFSLVAPNVVPPRQH